jgi:rhodanese-related sulfurtransferase/lysophospholipase L1-like esterase
MDSYMKLIWRTGAPLILLMLWGAGWTGVIASQDATRWEEAIRKFEAADKKSPPGNIEALFLGSSSIKGWDLERYFPGKETLNRGFGGSQISDSLYYADRIVFPYAPRVLVFYAGDNDIAAGESPQTVFEDFQKFVSKVRSRLTETRIVFVSIKPSLKRWHLVAKMRETNRLIRQFAELEAGLDFLDIDEPMIGPDGKPRPELFAKDGLHLSSAGYQLWSDALNKLLESARKQELPDRDPLLACELVRNEDALLLDVRTWWEYSVYRIPGARNIWVGDLPKRLDEVNQALGGNRDKPIVVYCTKGMRASKAKEILWEAGFGRVTNLGGISDWRNCD